MNQLKVCIIILNWNGWRDTIECLESLYQITYPNYEVIVVDNGSEDESIDRIKEYCKGIAKVESKFFEYCSGNKPIEVAEYTREEVEDGAKRQEEKEDFSSGKRLTIINNGINQGFSGGNNIGIKYALKSFYPDYILLLNNDTVVAREFLTEMVQVAESDRKVGIIGAKIYFYSQPEKIQGTGGNINWWLGYISSCRNGCDSGQDEGGILRGWVSGACFLVKRSVIENISLLDTSFFFGVEDFDYCTRAKKAGFKVIYVPRAHIWHKKGVSRRKILQHRETWNIIGRQSGRGNFKVHYRLFSKHRSGVRLILPLLGIIFLIIFRLYFLIELLQLVRRREWQIIRQIIKEKVKARLRP